MQLQEEWIYFRSQFGGTICHGGEGMSAGTWGAYSHFINGQVVKYMKDAA